MAVFSLFLAVFVGRRTTTTMMTDRLRGKKSQRAGKGKKKEGCVESMRRVLPEGYMKKEKTLSSLALRPGIPAIRGQPFILDFFFFFLALCVRIVHRNKQENAIEFVLKKAHPLLSSIGT